jgi:hypothetical protein
VEIFLTLQGGHPGVHEVELSEHDHDVDEDDGEADGHQDSVVQDGLAGNVCM